MYSEWHKIDLHIHTETLTSKLKVAEVEMISLTDHNIINEEAYREIAPKDICFLVGVELDIALDDVELETYVRAIARGDNAEKITVKPFHALLIFKSKDYSSISRKLEGMYRHISSDLFKGSVDMSSKKNLRTTTFKFIAQCFQNEDYFVIAHGNKDKGIVGPYKAVDRIEEAQYEILFGEISALEMKSNINMEHVVSSYNEGFKKLISHNFQKEDTTSYVVFSDNHNCQEYEVRDFQTWVKGELSYETIRICFSDPKSRIHTERRKPTHGPNFIEEINIKLVGMPSQRIALSPYLNVIIGGRSSGKSLLFNALLGLNSSLQDEDRQLFTKTYAKLIDADGTKIKEKIGSLGDKISIDCEAYCQEKIIELFKSDSALRERLQQYFPEFNETEVSAAEGLVTTVFSDLISSYKKYHDSIRTITKGDFAPIMRDSLRESKKLFELDHDLLTSRIVTTPHDAALSEIIELSGRLVIISNLKLIDQPIFTAEESSALINASVILNQKISLIEMLKKQAEITNIFLCKVTNIVDDYNKTELDQERQQIEFARKKIESDLKDYANFFRARIALRKSSHAVEGLNIKIDDKTKNDGRYSFVSKLNLEITKELISEELFEVAVLDYDVKKSLDWNLCEMASENSSKRIKQKTIGGKSPENFSQKVKEFIAKKKSRKQYEILENGENPVSTASTSQGKRASMFLDIKLNSFLAGQRRSVLLVDQIEDNIDNKYIGTELVRLLRDLKANMQVILVTHNPSIAIYGDAENIIIADNSEGKITFSQGGLENKAVRDEACRILDGGDIAFKNRMDKYNISRMR
jgi:hypothetical protein